DNDKDNDEDVLNGIVDVLKPYVQYNVSGWHIKRTKKSKWIPVIEECLLVFMRKKLGAHSKMFTIDILDIEALRLKLLVL
ncbi:MAG: hypothetical protein EB127_27320, partial [Alphaproteobacteria bacterium]|nr:hypothetical protein [Alphaproteobacteria bacterium]